LSQDTQTGWAAFGTLMYGAEGERVLAEYELDHLPGSRATGRSGPAMRPGTRSSATCSARSWDAAHQLRDELGELDPAVSDLLIALADRAAATWDDPDAGMGEARDKTRQYLSSKVMCWVALDRALALAPRGRSRRRRGRPAAATAAAGHRPVGDTDGETGTRRDCLPVRRPGNRGGDRRQGRGDRAGWFAPDELGELDIHPTQWRQLRNWLDRTYPHIDSHDFPSC
jgi:hypothetical protein